MGEFIRLADYASAIEMAFAANLLITAWAAFQERWKNEEAAISKEVDDLEKNEFLEEELSFERIRQTIEFWHQRGRRLFWRSALLAAVIFALFLYGVAWHFDMDAERCCAWKMALISSAYTSPILMLAMVVTWLIGNGRANSQLEKLRDQARKKRKEGLKAFAEAKSQMPPNGFGAT